MEVISCACPASKASEFVSAYEKLKLLVVTNQFRPDEHLQASNLAEHLAVGITPVREALIRLSAEGLITVRARRGFFARVLTINELHELYHLAYYLLRAALQWGGGRLGVKVSAAAATSALDDKQNDRSAALAFMIEQLHEQIARLSGNAQVEKVIRNYNCRTHAARLIYVEQFKDLDSSVNYIRTLSALMQLNDRETIIARLKQCFDAKTACIPELIKEVTAQAFSAGWQNRHLQSIDFARRRDVFMARTE